MALGELDTYNRAEKKNSNWLLSHSRGVMCMTSDVDLERGKSTINLWNNLLWNLGLEWVVAVDFAGNV